MNGDKALAVLGLMADLYTQVDEEQEKSKNLEAKFRQVLPVLKEAQAKAEAEQQERESHEHAGDEPEERPAENPEE